MLGFKIYVEDARRVRDLEAQVAALEGEREALVQEVKRLEFKYRCESVVNLELTDLCRSHGVDFRPALKRRPWEEMPGGLEHQPFEDRGTGGRVAEGGSRA